MSVIGDQGTKARVHASGETHRVVRRAPPAKLRAHGPQFFMPGEEGGSAEMEERYAALCEVVRAETELTPRARRIFSVSCRFKGRDSVLEVGKTIPSGEGPILAILDVGGDQPYCIQMVGDQPSLRLGKRVYSVTEFRAV